jgi:hypothetical protein
MLSRLRLASLTAALASSAFLAAQGRLEVTQPILNLGKIAAAGDVRLTWSLRNAGNQELRLDRVDALCPKTIAAPVNGILKPGDSTEIRGVFDARHFGGQYRGEVRIVTDLGSSYALFFTADIEPNIEAKSPLAALVKDIHPRREVDAEHDIRFGNKSGEPMDPDEVEILSSLPYLNAEVTTDGTDLVVTPYVIEKALPLTMSGQGTLTVHFTGCGSLDFSVPVQWERADPLIIREVAPKIFEVSYEDDRVFSLKSLHLAPGLRYDTKSIRGGRAMLFSPVKPKPRPKPAPGSQQPPAAKPKPKPMPKTASTKPKPTLPELLINAVTTHPYRSQVTIDRRKPSTGDTK